MKKILCLIMSILVLLISFSISINAVALDDDDDILTTGSHQEGDILCGDYYYRMIDSQSGDAGSIPAGATIYDPLAQLEEHLTFNQGARSSRLRWITKYGSVIQLSRIPDCLSGGCGFESRPSRHMGRWCSGSTVVCGTIRASSNLALPSK